MEVSLSRHVNKSFQKVNPEFDTKLKLIHVPWNCMYVAGILVHTTIYQCTTVKPSLKTIPLVKVGYVIQFPK